MITSALCEIGADAVPVLYEYLSRAPDVAPSYAPSSVWFRGWRVVAKLTAHQPCPELRRLLPLFPSFPVQSSRLTLQEAYFLTDLRRRIEAATEEWKSLPVATAAPVAGSEHLPLPADGRNGDLRALPQPASGTDLGSPVPRRFRTRLRGWVRRRLGREP